jgi:hypothetical protein
MGLRNCVYLEIECPSSWSYNRVKNARKKVDIGRFSVCEHLYSNESNMSAPICTVLLFFFVGEYEILCTFSTDASCKLNIFWHDGL